MYPFLVVSDAPPGLYLVCSHLSNLSIARTTWPLPAGENASTCYGSVLQGQFEGTIRTTNGAYHVESMQRYTSSPTEHHSIIYREEDMSKTSSILILARREKKICYPSSHRTFSSVLWLCGNTHLTPRSDVLHSLANLTKKKWPECKNTIKKVSCCICTPATLRLMLQLEASNRDKLINLSSALILQDLKLQPEATRVQYEATQGR